MEIQPRHTEDLKRLRDRICREQNAKQRDRYRAVLLALEGHQTKAIMHMLDRSKNFVQRWSYAYRDGGLGAVTAKRPTGRPSKLTDTQERQFRQRMLDGPTEDDDVCSLRGQDARRIIEQEFGVRYSLPGVYDLLHRLGLSCLRPRPRHRKNDPQTMQKWLEEAPLLSTESDTNSHTKK